MTQKILNLNLNYKIEFDDIKTLSFYEDIKKRVDDFILSDNHCVLFRGDELINSYIFQAFYNEVEKTIKSIYISLVNKKSSILNNLESFDFIFIESFNDCYEDKYSEIDLFNLYNSSKSNGAKLILRENSLIQKKISLPDLKSRIDSNFEIIIPTLTDFDKTNIIEIELKKRGLSINKLCLDFIMNHSSRNLESLQNLVNKLDQLTMERKKNISIPLIKELI